MTTTTNLGMTLPAVGADADTWGTELNTDLTTLDAMLAGLITGLTLSTAGSSATFGIAAGAASGMALGSAYTKTTGAWAVGTGNGALDTGAIANSTWYHVWLIQRVDTGVVDLLVSLSPTAPTLPTNYTRQRRIGAMLTDTSAHWYKFIQLGDEFIWAVPFSNISTSLTTTPALGSLSVPSGVQVKAMVRGYVSDTVVNTTVLFSSPDETSGAANSPTGNVSTVTQVANEAAPFVGVLRTNTSSQIRMVASAAVATCVLTATGWIDPRGQW